MKSHSYLFSLSKKGLTVCMMSVVCVKPGQMGDSLFLTRLEKGAAPLTVHIPTAKQRVSALLHGACSSRDWRGLIGADLVWPRVVEPHQWPVARAGQHFGGTENRQRHKRQIQVVGGTQGARLSRWGGLQTTNFLSACGQSVFMTKNLFFSETAQRHGGPVGRLEKPTCATCIRSWDPQTGAAALQGFGS